MKHFCARILDRIGWRCIALGERCLQKSVEIFDPPMSELPRAGTAYVPFLPPEDEQSWRGK